MAVQSRDWIELHELLKESVGEQTADKLMEFLPPVGWADVATKDDVRSLGVELRGEMAELRGEMAELRGEMAELRGEMAELRSEVREEMAELRSELRGEMAELRTEMAKLRSEIASIHGSVMKWVAGIVVAGMGASAAIAAGVASVMAG